MAHQIEQELIRRGCPKDEAAQIAIRCEAHRKSLVRRSAVRSFLLGLVGFAFGAMFAGLWGGLLFGGIGMAQAAYRLITGKMPTGRSSSSPRRYTIF